MVFASIIFFIYNYYTFYYMSDILIGFKKIPVVFLALSTVNTLLMILSYYLKIPYYISYFTVLIILSIEFLIFSKSKFSQILVQAGIIILNISSAQILFINLQSLFKRVIPYELFHNENLFFSNLSLLFIFLSIMLTITNKIVSKEDIIKVSTTKNYSRMVSPIIIFILLYTIVDIVVMQSKNFSYELSLVFISTSILTLVLFYILFFHSIKSVKMVAFKRKSDKLELEKYKNIIDKKNIEDKLYKDTLTSCYNRKFIMSALEDLKENNIYDFTILFIDIDKLKFVNDTFGHSAGDEYIVNISNCIKESIRSSDILARIGGDEFLAILNNTSEQDIEYVLNRIKNKISFVNNLTKEYTVSISIGYIFVDKNLLETGIDNIIKMADANMLIEKKLAKEKEIEC